MILFLHFNLSICEDLHINILVGHKWRGRVSILLLLLVTVLYSLKSKSFTTGQRYYQIFKLTTEYFIWSQKEEKRELIIWYLKDNNSFIDFQKIRI